MINAFRYIVSMMILLFSLGTVFSATIPYTDINPSDPHYEAVSELYNWQIITDYGDHLFYPDNLVTRDFFISLSVGVGCHKCETPNMEDIIQYRISPFPDLTNTNRYYYCIAYARDNDLISGYPLDKNGNASCENKKQYTSSPFCPENTVTRIEATKLLLIQAKLWNDTLNSGDFPKNTIIPDVTPYWYGYAKKWLEIGIIQQKTDGNIGQDEKITRKEFAMMTARILRYNQCQLENITDTAGAEISIQDWSGNTLNKTNFSKWEWFILVPKINGNDWVYNWIIRNPNTWELITKSGSTLIWWELPEWNWFITLQITNPEDSTVVSAPYATINIWNSPDVYQWNIGIQTKDWNFSNTDTFSITQPITFVSNHIWWPWDQTWQATNEEWKVITENWDDFPWSNLWEGLWTITLTVKEPWTDKIVHTDTRIINIIPWSVPANTNIQYLSPNITTDSLVTNVWKNNHFEATISDSSSWTLYKWDFWDGNIVEGKASIDHVYENSGIYSVTLTTIDPVSWNIWQSKIIVWISGDKDSDGDWTFDDADQCPLVYSIDDSLWCPLISVYNSDKIASEITQDGWSPGPFIWSSWDWFSDNACLAEKQKSQWLLVGESNCTQCPCSNKINIDSSLRSCDIVFPAILSPTLDTVYARGWLYLIP